MSTHVGEPDTAPAALPETLPEPRPVAYDIDVSERGIAIDGELLRVVTVSSLMHVLGDPRIPDPDPMQVRGLCALNWDAAGICVFTPDGEHVDHLEILLARDAAEECASRIDMWEQRPRQIMTGSLTVSGGDPFDALLTHAVLTAAPKAASARLGEWVIEWTFHHEAYLAVHASGASDFTSRMAVYRAHRIRLRSITIEYRPGIAGASVV